MIFSKKLFTSSLVLLVILAGCKKEHYNFNDLPPVVKSYFTITETEFDIGKEIHFVNDSKNAESYTWDFGDGTSSTEKDAVKTYAAPGIYTVKLKSVGPGGTGIYSTDITVIDPNANVGKYGELYFIEYNADLIKKVSLEPGSSPEVVADLSDIAGVGLAYDSVNKKIYFTDFQNTDDGKIWRINEDGTDPEALVSGITDPYSIVVNIDGGKIYWADDAGNISRANLDGTGLERTFIHIDDGQMRGIAYDYKTDFIYFYEVNNEDLYVAKSDGTGIAKVVSGTYGYSIFVDEVNNKLYYDDRRSKAIMQANLDGSGSVKIADAPGTRIHGMAIDYRENKLYWADRDNGTIKRANLDGTGVENFLSGLGSPRGIFIQ